VQITTLSGGPVKFVTGMFLNVTWTQDGSNNDWYCTLPSTGANGLQIIGAQAVWDNQSTSPVQTFTQVTPAGTITSMGFIGWVNTQAAVQSTPGSAFPPPYGTSASGSWTTSQGGSGNPLTMTTSNPGNVVAGMNVYDYNLKKIIGTVASYSGTALTLNANAAYASSGSADVIQFFPTTLYVQTGDSRKPDSNIFVMLSGGQTRLAPWLNSSTITYNVYMKNVGFWGPGILDAGGAINLSNASTGNRWQLQFDTCDFSYTGGLPQTFSQRVGGGVIGLNNISHADGGDDFFFYNCTSTSAWNDCFNTHVGSFGVTNPYRVVYAGCIGVDGNLARDLRNSQDTGSNAFTFHGYLGVVSAGCYGDSSSVPWGGGAIDSPGGPIYAMDCGGTYASYYGNTGGQGVSSTSDTNVTMRLSQTTDVYVSTGWFLGTTMLSTGSYNIACEKSGSAVSVWQAQQLNSRGNFGSYTPSNYEPTFS
jgi:hypothetical protein